MLAVGVNFRLANAVLIAASVPVNTILPSAVPSPIENDRPVIVPSVIVPLGVAPKSSVTCIVAPKSSGSATDMPAMALSVLSSLTVTVAGDVNTGFSLTLEILILKLAVRVLLPSVAGPVPSSPLYLSSTVAVINTVASTFGLVGVYTNVFKAVCTAAVVPLTMMVAVPLLSTVVPPTVTESVP